MSAPRFKVGDRVRVKRNDAGGGSAPGVSRGDTGTVMDRSAIPWVRMDRNGGWSEVEHLGIPKGHGACFFERDLEPITNDTMSDELKVTKAAVLEAASKCSTAKATLQVLFPDAFKKDDEPFEFGGTTWTTAVAYSEGPLMVADSSAPYDLKHRCLLVCPGWEMRQQEHEGRTILTFHRKP